MGRVISAIKGWNLFRDSPLDAGWNAGQSMPYRRPTASGRHYADRSIIGSIYTRLSVDLSSIEFFHATLEKNADVAIEVRSSGLQKCLSLSPNVDQSAQMFKQDIALTMFEQGHAAIVPVDADADPTETGGYDIKQLRVGRVVAWFPQRVTVEVYDDRERDEKGEPINGGIVKQMTVPKSMVAIVENPFFNVMNEPSGLLQRLLRKLAILDGIDEAAGDGKLDLIFQLPYTVRGESRKKQAEDRRKILAEQLKDDELGIGYIDVSEKVIQLNRKVDNKMLEQIEYLHNAVKTELGITDAIMNGSADRDTIINYYDRTIEPIANAIRLEVKRKFLTNTALTQRQSIEIFRDPLKLIPISELAELVDKLSRNAVVTANEIRPKIGFMPSKDPSANKLINPNMPVDDQQETPPPKEEVNDAGLPSDPPS